MGRRSIEKTRKPLTPKAKMWVRELVPLLQNQPLDQLTLDELAELVGKSKSTIYTYFSTKEEIYYTAVQLVLDDMKFIVSPEATEGENMEQVLRNMMHRISEGIEGISIGFLEQIQLLFPGVWMLIQDFTDKLLVNFERIYRNGMKQGTFNQFNPKLLIALDRHFIMSIMTDAEHFSTPPKLSLEELVNEYLKLRLNALRAG